MKHQEQLTQDIIKWIKEPPELHRHTAPGCGVCGLGSRGVVTNYACTRDGCPIKATAQ
jgi:hypothetical protein